MTGESQYYRVAGNLDNAPLSDYLMHGYESRIDFYRALRRMLTRWAGRVGECVGERHVFLLLRFHDTPGGKPEEAWLPTYLLQPAAIPEYMVQEEPDPDAEINEELDRIYGFD